MAITCNELIHNPVLGASQFLLPFLMTGLFFRERRLHGCLFIFSPTSLPVVSERIYSRAR